MVEDLDRHRCQPSVASWCGYVGSVTRLPRALPVKVSEEKGTNFGTGCRIWGRRSDRRVESGAICGFVDEAFQEDAVEGAVDDRLEVAKEAAHLRLHRMSRWPV